MLWTSKVCPFAERTVIALHEMGIAFDPVEVDLKNKPASLFEVNPKGLVPAMKDQGHCVNDSYIILQYIDDMWEGPDKKCLLPKDPVGRATARTLCEFMGTNVVNVFYQILMKQDPAEQEEAKEKMLKSLKALNDAITVGPFFMGSDFSIVDIMLAPFVERFAGLKFYRGFQVPETAEYERFNTWWKTVQERPSFQPARLTDEFIIETYKKYADGTAQSKVADATRTGKAMP